jgi:hypothetical protein
MAGLESIGTAAAPLPATTTSSMMILVQEKAPLLPAREGLDEMLGQTDIAVIVPSNMGDSTVPTTKLEPLQLHQCVSNIQAFGMSGFGNMGEDSQCGHGLP